jgi:hypothetical protein
MLGISGTGHQVRFQMQPATAHATAAASRGGQFAKKLGQIKSTSAQASDAQRTGEPQPKVKKRKLAPQFEQQTQAEIEARLLEQQLQAERAARSSSNPLHRGS